MVVRFYDKENMMFGDDDNTTSSSRTNSHANCNCNTYQQQTASVSTASSTATQTSNGLHESGGSVYLQKPGTYREIVGNCKEVRIEENNHNLRIVGNNNRIRITYNMGDLTVIGNNTRLKIKANHGHIKYTGNDGRICLGKDSTEQLVDYNGCNGVLKVVNSNKFQQQHKSSQNNDNDEEVHTMKTESSAGTECINGKFMGINKATTMNNTSKKSKGKSASFGGPSFDRSDPFTFHIESNNALNRKRSMPNMTINPPTTVTTKKSHQMTPASIVHNFGNIVIANSANICISPYTC